MRHSTIAAVVTCAMFAIAAGTVRAEDSGIGQFGKDLGAGVAQGLKAGLLPSADKDFMMNAASGGIAEVEMARVALDKSKSPAVKKHAQHMINDHTQANDELRRIATAKGVTLADVPNANHKAMVDKIRDASAADFDKTYIREAGVRAHQEMQTLFRNESTSGADPDLKAFASKTLPTVETHLKQSERIEEDLRTAATR
jgi:putative membrane protein